MSTVCVNPGSGLLPFQFPVYLAEQLPKQPNKSDMERLQGGGCSPAKMKVPPESLRVNRGYPSVIFTWLARNPFQIEVYRCL